MSLISMTFLVDNFRKAALIQMISFMLLLKTYAYNFLLLLVFMLNFNLTRIPLLNLREIKEGNLKTLTDLLLEEIIL